MSNTRHRLSNAVQSMQTYASIKLNRKTAGQLLWDEARRRDEQTHPQKQIALVVPGLDQSTPSSGRALFDSIDADPELPRLIESDAGLVLEAPIAMVSDAHHIGDDSYASPGELTVGVEEDPIEGGRIEFDDINRGHAIAAMMEELADNVNITVEPEHAGPVTLEQPVTFEIAIDWHDEVDTSSSGDGRTR